MPIHRSAVPPNPFASRIAISADIPVLQLIRFDNACRVTPSSRALSVTENHDISVAIFGSEVRPGPPRIYRTLAQLGVDKRSDVKEDLIVCQRARPDSRLRSIPEGFEYSGSCGCAALQSEIQVSAVLHAGGGFAEISPRTSVTRSAIRYGLRMNASIFMPGKNSSTFCGP